MERRSFILPAMIAGVLMGAVVSCDIRSSDGDVIPSAQRKDVSRCSYVDAAGFGHTLSEHLGKVVVVDIWATWCPPCRRSLPGIAALQGKENSDFTVIAISVDRKGWDDVRPFLNANAQLGLRAAVPMDGKSLDAVGSISVIPTTLIVDRKGRLRQRWSGYYEGKVEAALQSALKEP